MVFVAGHLVTDLAKTDFEIKDEGKLQTIESFASIGMLDPHNATPDTGTSSLSTTDRVVRSRQRRLIVFFISDPWIPFSDTGYLRDLLHRFVDRHMADHDEVAIWPVTNRMPQQEFTSDRVRLDAVIDRTQGTYAGIPVPPDQLLAHLDTVLDRMAGIVGRRKVVIVLGGEVLPPSLIGTSLFEDVLRRAAAANVGIYPIGVTGVVGMGEIIGPSSPGRALPSLLALSILAQETGGVVANRNDVDRSLERVEEDAGSYYLIGFSPAAVRVTPGHLRRLTVKVRRNGTIVQARRGYMPLPASGPL
jgi:VWFA-related protein